MTSGAAPAVAPDAQRVPRYAAAGVNDDTRIGAYAGAAVRESDGSLFGAICGLDPQARTDDRELLAAGPVLALLGQLLSLALALERARADARLELSAISLVAETDSLTGAANRRGWERALAEEDARLQRLGDPAVLVVVDLDGLKTVNDTAGHEAGDDYLRRAARALLGAVQQQDRVARTGGDEFGVLLSGCTGADAEPAVRRLRTALEAVGVAASLGWSSVVPSGGTAAAVRDADAAMYADKLVRRSARQSATA